MRGQRLAHSPAPLADVDVPLCAYLAQLGSRAVIPILPVGIVDQGLEVGVDIEWINADVATDDIADRFFSASEVQTLKSLTDSERVQAFFACWTRKEAYIKARGEGFSISLDGFTVAFSTETPAEIFYANIESTIVEQWSVFSIDVSEGYKADLVIKGKNRLITQMEWNLSLES